MEYATNQGGNVIPRSIILSAAFLLFFLTPVPSPAQVDDDEEPAASRQGWQPSILVDCPTAGTLKRGSFDAIMRAYPNGGILVATDIGLSNRLMLGISYGAEGIIAEERPIWNPRIEFNVKLSLVDETLVTPAISLGFCSQGFGSYHENHPTLTTTRIERYTFKSKGFYVVGSKNYPVSRWQLGLHGGGNYSMEQEDGDKNLDFFVGFDTRLNKDVGWVMEYDFATNDDKSGISFGRGKGYLNMAIQWLYADNLVLEILLKNLNNNRRDAVDIWRGLRVTYVESF